MIYVIGIILLPLFLTLLVYGILYNIKEYKKYKERLKLDDENEKLRNELLKKQLEELNKKAGK
jgi:cell shape-determining protein MreC